MGLGACQVPAEAPFPFDQKLLRAELDLLGRRLQEEVAERDLGRHRLRVRVARHLRASSGFGRQLLLEPLDEVVDQQRPFLARS